MRWLALCSILVFATAANASVLHSWWKQASSVFLNPDDAPHVVIKNYGEFKQEKYFPKKWACASLDGDYKILTTLKWYLDNYFSGVNSKNLSMPQTNPVTTEYEMVTENNNRYTMCYFIPEEDQAEPPMPTHGRVQILPKPEMTVFTRTINPCPDNEAKWVQEAGKLIKLIHDKTGKTVSDRRQYWVGFHHSPNVGLRCELWIPYQP